MYHESIPVIIGSGDVASFGPGTGTPSSTAGDFTVPLVQSLELPGRWQVRLDNVSFPNPNFMKTPPTSTANSIVILLPGTVAGSIVGSGLLPLVYKTGPSTPSNTTAPYIYVHDQSPLPTWFGVTPSIITQLRCQILEIDGTPVPSIDPDALITYSTVSLVFRRVGD